MGFKQGTNSYLGLGAEGTYGVAATRSRFLTFRSDTIKPEEDRAESGDLYRLHYHSGQVAQAGLRVSGDVTIVPRYHSNGFQLLLEHLLGSVVQSRPDITSAPTVYRYTYTPANALKIGLTIEDVKDDQAFLCTGCKLTSGRFTFRYHQPMEFTFGMIGKQVIDGNPLTPISFLDAHMIVLTSATVTWGGSSLTPVTAGEITIGSPLEPVQGIEARTMSNILRGDGHMEISGSLTTYFQDLALWSNWRNAQMRTLVLTCQGLPIIGAYYYELQITMPIVDLRDAHPPSTRTGPFTQTCPFKAYVDDADVSPITIRLTNENNVA